MSLAITPHDPFLVECLKLFLHLDLVAPPVQLIFPFLSPLLLATNNSQAEHGAL